MPIRKIDCVFKRHLKELLYTKMQTGIKTYTEYLQKNDCLLFPCTLYNNLYNCDLIKQEIHDLLCNRVTELINKNINYNVITDYNYAIFEEFIQNTMENKQYQNFFQQLQKQFEGRYYYFSDMNKNDIPFQKMPVKDQNKSIKSYFQNQLEITIPQDIKLSINSSENLNIQFNKKSFVEIWLIDKNSQFEFQKLQNFLYNNQKKYTDIFLGLSNFFDQPNQNISNFSELSAAKKILSDKTFTLDLKNQTQYFEYIRAKRNVDILQVQYQVTVDKKLELYNTFLYFLSQIKYDSKIHLMFQNKRDILYQIGNLNNSIEDIHDYIQELNFQRILNVSLDEKCNLIKNKYSCFDNIYYPVNLLLNFSQYYQDKKTNLFQQNVVYLKQLVQEPNQKILMILQREDLYSFVQSMFKEQKTQNDHNKNITEQEQYKLASILFSRLQIQYIEGFDEDEKSQILQYQNKLHNEDLFIKPSKNELQNCQLLRYIKNIDQLIKNMKSIKTFFYFRVISNKG